MNNHEKLRQDILQKLKGLAENVTDSIGDLAKGKPVFVEPVVQSNRIEICNKCPFFVNNTTQCKKCGCFMSAKTRLKQAECPIGRWGKDI